MPHKNKEEKKKYHQEYYKNLKAGKISAKGIRPVNNILGSKFGSLTAIRYSHRQGPLQRPYWEFLCDCGNARVMAAADVIAGKTKACGCKSQGKTVRYNDGADGVAFRTMYNAYKNAAKNRGFVFELSHEEFRVLTKSNCTYCGTEPTHERRASGKYRPVYTGNGVDRVDNLIGYTKDNSTPCCKTCNHAKHTMSATEFNNWLDRIVKFRTQPNTESPATAGECE